MINNEAQLRLSLKYSNHIVTCISDYSEVLDWMIGYIAPYYRFTHFGTIGNTALPLFYTLSSSPLHTH
jgi:hypothetical protein